MILGGGQPISKKSQVQKSHHIGPFPKFPRFLVWKASLTRMLQLVIKCEKLRKGFGKCEIYYWMFNISSEPTQFNIIKEHQIWKYYIPDTFVYLDIFVPFMRLSKICQYCLARQLSDWYCWIVCTTLSIKWQIQSLCNSDKYMGLAKVIFLNLNTFVIICKVASVKCN